MKRNAAFLGNIDKMGGDVGGRQISVFTVLRLPNTVTAHEKAKTN